MNFLYNIIFGAVFGAGIGTALRKVYFATVGVKAKLEFLRFILFACSFLAISVCGLLATWWLSMVLYETRFRLRDEFMFTWSLVYIIRYWFWEIWWKDFRHRLPSKRHGKP